jgi:hypothetical protein
MSANGMLYLGNMSTWVRGDQVTWQHVVSQFFKLLICMYSDNPEASAVVDTM